jgi:hypothetical protein
MGNFVVSWFSSIAGYLCLVQVFSIMVVDGWGKNKEQVKVEVDMSNWRKESLMKAYKIGHKSVGQWVQLDYWLWALWGVANVHFLSVPLFICRFWHTKNF